MGYSDMTKTTSVREVSGVPNPKAVLESRPEGSDHVSGQHQMPVLSCKTKMNAAHLTKSSCRIWRMATASRSGLPAMLRMLKTLCRKPPYGHLGVSKALVLSMPGLGP